MSRQIVTFNFNFGQTSQQNQLTVANGGGLWKRFFGGRRKLALDLLPADIIVDEIMSRLNMKDIGALRRVNWNLHLLTKQPAVWKRFLPQLPRMPFPLPALPPTAKYDRHGLCALDIERLVTRAITFDNNWLGEKCPQPYYIMPYATYQHLLSMVLLPGSHYMVASVVDGAGQYAVMVWAMEHPSCDGPVPLVIRYTEFKAYHLQAKYMTVSGEKGITISFLRKRHKSNTDTRDIPESLQAGGPAEPEDPYMPLKYDCTTLHITLNSLDILTDRRYKPGTKEFEHVARAQRDAIKKVSSIRTGRQLGALTLEEIDGAAYVAVVKRPDTIVLENLSTNVRTVIQCPHPQAYPNYDCQIWNLRLLPLQRQIFVIRTVTMTPTMANDVHLLELYDIPPFGTEKRVTANESRIISLEGVTNIQMSDLLPAPEGDESIWPMLSKGRLPPPITVYFCRERGVQVYCMWAKLVEIPASPPATPGIAQNIKKGKMKAVAEPQKWYYYTLEAGLQQNTVRVRSHDKDNRLRVLPGAYRALFQLVPKDSVSIAPPVSDLWAYHIAERGESFTRLGRFDEEEEALYLQHESDAAPVLPTEEQEVAKMLTGDDEEIWPYPRMKRSPKGAKIIDMHPQFSNVMRNGVAGMAWDESVGRMCVSTPHDSMLYVVDFAFLRSEDAYDIKLIEEKAKPLAVMENEVQVGNDESAYRSRRYTFAENDSEDGMDSYDGSAHDASVASANDELRF